MFDIKPVLERFEEELNGYPNKGFKFEIDKERYSQELGAGGHLIFDVTTLYDPSNHGTPVEILSTFYAALSAFIDNNRLNGEFDLKLNQKAMGLMRLEAKVNIPMTYSDFGDQI